MGTKGSYKTAIPGLAKEIITRKDSFIIPPLFFTLDNKYQVFPAKQILLKKVEVERMFETQRPMTVILSPQLEYTLLLEILVDKRHTFENKDYDYLKKNNIYCIEIDARKLKKEHLSNGDLELLINGVGQKYWIYNPDHAKIEAFLKKEYSKSKQANKSQVLNCPVALREEWKIKRAFAYITECQKCQYCVLKDEISTSQKVNCLGHLHSNFRKLINEAKEKLFPGQLAMPGLD